MSSSTKMSRLSVYSVAEYDSNLWTVELTDETAPFDDIHPPWQKTACYVEHLTFWLLQISCTLLHIALCVGQSNKNVEICNLYS